MNIEARNLWIQHKSIKKSKGIVKNKPSRFPEGDDQMGSTEESKGQASKLKRYRIKNT